MKKILSLAIALALLLGCIPAQAADKNLDVFIWYRDTDDLNFGDMRYFAGEDGIEAKTGIHADFTKVPGSEWQTKLNLLFASGEYPDIIMRGNNAEFVETYGVDQEILIPLDDYIQQYMPNYAARLAADPALAEATRSSDGKTYYIGWLIPQNINVESHLFVNKQWLQNLGLEAPKTVQGFEDMLRAFKEKDANGNGDASDEIPFTGSFKSGVDGMTHLLSFWGVPYNEKFISIANDGKVTSPLQGAGLRDALEVLHKWYAEGLIDMEAVAQDTNAFEAKVNAGNSGSFWRWRMKAMGTDDAVVEQYECIVPVAAEGYTAVVPKHLEIPAFGAALTVNCKDIEAALTWLDAQLDFETMLTGYNGYVDTPADGCWEYDASGKVTIISPPGGSNMTVPGQSGMFYMSGKQYFDLVNMPVHRVEKSDYCAMYTQAGIVEENSWHLLTKVAKLNVQETEEATLLHAEIQKFADETFVKFITKGITDADWDNYVKTMDNLRINDYIAVYQGAYDRMNAAE